MKLMMLLTSDNLAGDVRTLLEHHGATCFVEIPRAHGCSGSVRRFDTAVWPGTVNLFLVFDAEEKLIVIRGALEAFARGCEHESCLKAAVLDVEDFLDGRTGKQMPGKG